MLGKIYTIDDVEVKGKTLLVRIDLNSSIGEDGKIQFNSRFASHGKTLVELAKKGAKVVAICHQGRPGDSEFRSLREHAALLSQATGIDVHFLQDVFGPASLDKIKNLGEGEVLLLENLRLLSEEMLERNQKDAAKSLHVQKLSGCVDLFVNDAFSVAHRSQASIVGFNALLPSVAGRVMQRELTAVDRLLQRENGAVFLLGGVKFKEVLDLTEAVCKNGKAKKILFTGASALLFLKAKGLALGEPTEIKLEKLDANNYIDRAKALLKHYSDVITTPVDLAVDQDTKRKEYATVDLPVNYLILDIGMKTISNYCQLITSAETVFAKGAPGNFEKREFSHSTRELCTALADSKAFTVLGGGSLLTAFEAFKIDKTRISHISLSGGALLEALAGKSLPGVEALEQHQS